MRGDTPIRHYFDSGLLSLIESECKFGVHLSVSRNLCDIFSLRDEQDACVYTFRQEIEEFTDMPSTPFCRGVWEKACSVYA